ncbi:Insulin-degrading enzyme-like 1 (peroxisomal) [Citrus sinensis]|uniref:insulin-degrading enzyme-like 1, peroxisomal isoform X3 n=1 Tax=Citrus sinensis TaxID=2711 RepID=UPI00219A89AF|nr:insulin-degrading enzyme-like 1, peroxisomal isoform X3 [Citrus sinensis]XP_052289861.1 insulin-degrading enzyme-like 1, peroxisomal isoform X3 [Citrus sinensis]KAH9648316.1 Insulin-degrading enzyme-like 1 (peroxisomal) [Citrus sinensis]
MAVGKDDVEIIKPRTDKRQYRRLVLKNSLQVLLISDPDADKCAASMNVSVGAFCDPVGLEGLAHFLEHMLFYASEKYPVEDSYLKYISEHGGMANAFTSSEHTNYYFDVNPDSFEEALDRFVQFFIKPLMSADATMREIKAVHSENQKNLLSDVWRINQLWKHLSSEDHPYHKFSTGNWETLEVRPRAKGLDTRHELIKFYNEHYSSNLMHLVVYSKESVDKIQGLVENKFQDIRNTDRNRFRFPGQPCTSEHLQILVRAVPIRQGHKLRIGWPITPSIHHYKEAPGRYISHLIGHESEGSLFYILKTLGWATSLAADEGDWTLDYSFFEVTVDLTDSGHEHMQGVVGLLFKYINLLQQSGASKWIFDELSAVCEVTFHYQDKVPPIDYVVTVAANMETYPPQDWLVGESLPSNFNPEIIQMTLKELSPKTVRIFWESKQFEGKTEMAEPWYGTAYSIENINESIIQDWILSAPKENLHLPAPNVFVPTDLSLKDTQEAKFPVLLRKSSYSTLWYKPDTMFSTPKAFVNIYFNCPHASSSPESEVLTDIFTRLLHDYLNEYAYYAQVAGLYYGINHTEGGFEVTVVGYNHKLRILLETIFQKIAQFKVQPDRFSVIKEMVTKEYHNNKFLQPYQLAMYYCSLILQDQTWPWTEELEVLPHLEAEDLAKFVPMMLSRTFLECYIAGNIESNEAGSIIQYIEDVFFKGSNPICQPLFPSQHLTNRVVKLEKGKNYVYSNQGLNPSDENSCLVHYIQVHRDDFLMNVALQLLNLIAKQPAFHQLRTVEQLGYITALRRRNDFGIHGVQFIIQSSVKGPKYIDLRVESFLQMFESKLYEMTSDQFKNNVNALIDMKLEKHKNLNEESGFYWHEISDGTLKFDRREAEVNQET